MKVDITELCLIKYTLDNVKIKMILSYIYAQSRRNILGLNSSWPDFALYKYVQYYIYKVQSLPYTFSWFFHNGFTANSNCKHIYKAAANSNSTQMV